MTTVSLSHDSCIQRPRRAERARAGRSAAWVALGVAAAALQLSVAPAQAKECGGAIRCECGDRVVASTVLTADLTNCDKTGLEVRAGILDCDGHLVAGPGDRMLGEGIWINQATGVAVRNCVVRNFHRGILVDSSTDSLVDHNEVFNNNVGVWVGEGSARNEIRSLSAHDNRDEGVHLGRGSSDNLVIDGEIIANRNENLYLIQTARNRIINNLFDRSTEASVLLKHSSDNFFSKNVLARRNIILRGDSSGNTFQNNQLHNGRFSFLALEEDDAWSFPRNNTVRGGRVLKAGTCFMFIGASNNTATDVLADRCRAMQEKEAGGEMAHDNVVSLNYIGGGSGGGGGGGGGGTPSAPSLPKGTLKFDDPGLGFDTLRIKGVLSSLTPLDALNEDVRMRFEDAGGVTYEVLVPAGTLRESGRSAEYENAQAGVLPGVDAIEIRRESLNTWSFRLAVTADLSGANEALMTLTVQVGASTFAFPDTWTQTSEGWRLR